MRDIGLQPLDAQFLRQELMKAHLRSHLRCPSCRGSVHKIPRDADMADAALVSIGDVSFWIFFAVFLAAGMWHWLAGVAATAGMLLLFYLWHRGRSRYRCQSCCATVGYIDLVVEERHEA